MTFLKSNIITLFSKIVCLASALFISVYIARFIGPAAKGTYYLLIQIVSILAAISVFGIDTASIFFLGKGYRAKKVVFLSSALTLVISVSVALAIFLMIKLVSGYFSPGVNRNYLYALILVLPFISMVRLNSAVMCGFGRYLAFNVLNIILFLTMAVMFVIFVIAARLGLAGAFISFILTYVFMSVIYVGIVIFSKQMALPSDKTVNVRALFNYSARVFLVPLILLVIYRVDSFFLSYFTDISAVGFYSVALSFAELLLFIPESTGTILFPTLAYAKAEEVNSKFSFMLRMSVVLASAVAAIFFISIRYILPLVYGELYLGSVKLVYILLPGLLAISTYYIFASYFMAIGRPGAITITLGAVLIEKIALCAIFVPWLGAVGAAFASTLSYLTCFLIFLAIFRQRVKFKVHEIFILKNSDINIIRNSLNDIFDFQK